MIHAKYKKKIFEEAIKTSHLTYQIGELEGLRQKSKDISVPEIKSQKVKSLISKLKSALREYRRMTGKGRGIAAIQIGVPLRISVVYENKKLMTIINPRITKKSSALFSYPEICMSANPIIAMVVRPAYLEFEYLNEDGDKQSWNEPDNRIMNRVFQHEIDHMEGIVNIDLVQSKELILNSDPKFLKNAKFEKV